MTEGTNVNGFTVIRKGAKRPSNDEQRPPDSLLKQVEYGAVVMSPDGTQWIAMPPLPARWERSKKPITLDEPQPSTTAEPQPASEPTPPAEHRSRK